MTRIGTYGANQLYVSRLLTIQDRMQTEQSQVSTGLVSTTYSGIAQDSGSVINLENEKAQASQYITDNNIAQTKLSAVTTTLTSIKTSVTNFRNQLNTFAGGNTKDQAGIQTLQNSAMRTMVDLQSYLGANLDGQYLFGGGRLSTPPVTLPTNNLQQFQSMFDGIGVTFPSTRDGSLQTLSLANRDTGNLNFDATNGLIYPSTASGFTKLAAGSHVTVTGTTLNNTDFSVRQQAATSAAGTMLSETSNIGSSAFITNSSGTLSHATTGNLALAFNAQGQMVMSPANPNTLQGLAVGSNFTIHGSSNRITPMTTADTTPLVGTNLSTYNAGSTAATGVTIAATDSLTLTDSGGGQYVFPCTGAPTMASLVAWINGNTAGTPNGAASATIDNQGRLNITNSAGSSLKISGNLQGLLGLPATVANAATVNSSALFDNVNSERLTNLKNAAGTPLAINDTLVMTSGTATTTFTVGATSTLTDLTNFIAQNDPSATTPGGAQVSFANNVMTINNNSGANYTFTGNVATTLGLPGGIGALSSGTSAALPDVPGNSDGAYSVLAYNPDGSVIIGNNTNVTSKEDVAVTSLSLSKGFPLAGIGTGLTSGNATFSLSGDTVTMTLPTGGTNMTTQYVAGDALTIGGTNNHNGTYAVSQVTANSISFQINPPALRVSQLVPQTGRSDVTMTFATTQADTPTSPPVPAPVPGTVLHGIGTLDQKTFGSLSFTPNGGNGEKISASVGNSFTDTSGNPYPPVGATITLKSTTGVNDGAYQIISNDGTNITFKSKVLVAENGASTATVATQSWYTGDTLNKQQRVGSDRQLDVGVLASDPAFEKTIRALGIIAQGAYGTAGGLENHPERVASAQFLLQDALDHPSAGPAPKGTSELPSDLTQVLQSVGSTQQVIQTQNDNHTTYMQFLETRVSQVEVADKTQAVATLMADSNALQGAYQALARVSQLSLLDFLK
jgi:flagellin-like hook-associated protein FlgL